MNGIVFDEWSIFHIFAGLAIGITIGFFHKQIKKRKLERAWLLSFIPIVGWELFEQAILVNYLPYVKELLYNSLLDIGLGVSFAYVGYKLIEK